MTAECQHERIETWRYAGSEPDAGKVALWACSECRLRFAPGMDGKVMGRLPQPELLGLAADGDGGDR